MGRGVAVGTRVNWSGTGCCRGRQDAVNLWRVWKYGRVPGVAWGAAGAAAAAAGAGAAAAVLSAAAAAASRVWPAARIPIAAAAAAVVAAA
eukprot:scaffold209582_cov16-Tisochrysis_lutea.AAC.2